MESWLLDTEARLPFVETKVKASTCAFEIALLQLFYPNIHGKSSVSISNYTEPGLKLQECIIFVLGNIRWTTIRMSSSSQDYLISRVSYVQETCLITFVRKTNTFCVCLFYVIWILDSVVKREEKR